MRRYHGAQLIEDGVEEQMDPVEVKPDKSMHGGYVQRAKLWYNTLIIEYLRSIGYEHNEVDPCIINRIIEGKELFEHTNADGSGRN
jgi:hypothetical protein